MARTEALNRFHTLLVLWRDSLEAGGRRFVIGRLGWEPDAKIFTFSYGDEIADAQTRGFRLLPEFPSETLEYRSPHLFAAFAQRVPSASRPDRARLFESWGIENPDDPMEILARSGGLSATDRLELAEAREETTGLRSPLEVRVAGLRYHEGRNDVTPGDMLTLQREPDNEKDPNAVKVLAPSGRSVGYIPRQYAPLVARDLDGGERILARALRRQGPDNERWVVELRVT